MLNTMTNPLPIKGLHMLHSYSRTYRELLLPFGVLASRLHATILWNGTMFCSCVWILTLFIPRVCIQKPFRQITSFAEELPPTAISTEPDQKQAGLGMPKAHGSVPVLQTRSVQWPQEVALCTLLYILDSGAISLVGMTIYIL